MLACCDSSSQRVNRLLFSGLAFAFPLCNHAAILLYYVLRVCNRMEDKLLENINRNLEVIIGLLLRSLPDTDAVHLRGRILMLNDMGMRPKDIARMLGKSANHINVELSLARNPKKKRSRKK